MTVRARHRAIGFLSAAIVLAAAATLLAMGRPPICPCGHVAIWHGAIDAETSQQLLDWYSLSHLIHGLLFYAALALLLPRVTVAARFPFALVVEAGWELVENSPIIIERYRTATAALGYTGDSVLNSLSDIACMSIGFLLARTLPARLSIVLAVAFELLTLVVIRDDLTLNVVMLLWPIEAIRHWQGAL